MPASTSPDLWSSQFPRQAPILLRHPGYPPPADCLFLFPRVDRQGDRVGIHHATALLACQIVANNAFEGKLYHDREGNRPVSTPRNGVLCEDEYYFHVQAPPAADAAADNDNPAANANANPADANVAAPIGPYRYPVLPRFADWKFPSEKSFRRLGWPSTTPQRPRASEGRGDGKVCALSGALWSLEMAHLVPTNESRWYSANGISVVASGFDVHSEANMVCLRSDLHKAMDDRMFAVVPKTDMFRPHPPGSVPSASEPEAMYVVHVLAEWTPTISQLASVYQNQPIGCHALLSPQCLLARFAWAIFQQMKRFIITGGYGLPHVVLSQAEDGSFISRALTPQQAMVMYGGGGSKNATPLKRSKRGSDFSTPAEATTEECDCGYGNQEEDEDPANSPRPLSKEEMDMTREQQKGDGWYDSLVAGLKEVSNRPKKRLRVQEWMESV